MGSYHHVAAAKRILKSTGYTEATVERYISQAQRRIDFCGFADLLAFRCLLNEDLVRNPALLSTSGRGTLKYNGVLAIQVSNYNNALAHYDKMTQGSPAPALREWLHCNNRCEIWAFPSPSNKITKGKKYLTKYYRISLDDTDEFQYENWTELAYLDTKYQNL